MNQRKINTYTEHAVCVNGGKSIHSWEGALLLPYVYVAIIMGYNYIAIYDLYV